MHSKLALKWKDLGKAHKLYKILQIKWKKNELDKKSNCEEINKLWWQFWKKEAEHTLHDDWKYLFQQSKSLTTNLKTQRVG